jgi:16S rRNA (cytidine1402-2'-O)-methyltransferase
MAGTLYVVGTPIGNAEDLSCRARRVMQAVQFIAAEDPQTTERLLQHHGIRTALTTYHDGNKEEKTPVFLQRLREGQNMALVVDAGTPALFDPGAFLISEALARKIPVTPIPGPSPALAAISVSGFSAGGVVLDGVLPKSRTLQNRLFNLIRTEHRTHVLFVPPRCFRATLQALRSVLGERYLLIGKNLTKDDEELLRGTASALLQRLGRRRLRGELTLVIQGIEQMRNLSGRKPIRRRRACGS